MNKEQFITSWVYASHRIPLTGRCIRLQLCSPGVWGPVMIKRRINGKEWVKITLAMKGQNLLVLI